MNRRLNRRRSFLRNRAKKAGFSLIEILVVVAIIGTLLALISPTIFNGIKKAQSAVCAVNLRNIGQAVSAEANDNGGQYPEINNGGPYSDYPPNSGAQTLGVALSPYGITAKTLQCPLDNQSPTYYNQTGTGGLGGPTTWGSSYEWSPALDDEALAAPVLYTQNAVIPLHSNKVRLCMDYVGWHRGRANRLYADGHVVQN